MWFHILPMTNLWTNSYLETISLHYFKMISPIQSCKLEDVKHICDKIQISCYKADEEQNLIFKLHRWELKTPVRMFLLDNSLSGNTNTRTSHYTHCTRHNTSLQTMLYNSPVTEYFSLSHCFSLKPHVDLFFTILPYVQSVNINLENI